LTRAAIVLLLVLVSLGMVACGQPESGSGVNGLAVVELLEKNPSPSSLPAGFGDAIWDEPDPGATVTVRGRQGGVVARIVAGADGTLRVALPPGDYWLQGGKMPKFFWTVAPIVDGEWILAKVTTDEKK
jgi:hypothetical protein